MYFSFYILYAYYQLQRKKPNWQALYLAEKGMMKCAKLLFAIQNEGTAYKYHPTEKHIEKHKLFFELEHSEKPKNKKKFFLPLITKDQIYYHPQESLI